MISTGRRGNRIRAGRAAAPPVGLFGDLGMGNIGNDASLEAILGFLRTDHPEVPVDAMCAGADTVHERYGVPAVPMSWYRYQGSEPVRAVLKVLGKGFDAVRIAAWVRRHDAVIVPGMGIFEATLPLRPWGLPYALFVVGVSGRLLRTKIAYVSVGAGRINQPVTRWLFGWAARLAYYRSYRDAPSRAAMLQWGLNIAADPIYPDLAFALPAPDSGVGDPRIVCVGVMDYRGSNDDRARAAEIRHSYVAEMTRLVRWLLGDGRSVQLLIGDTNGSDDEVVQEIVANVRQAMPDLDPSRLMAHSVVSLADVMAAMAPAGSVIAIRFHNIVAAIMLGKPTIAVSYGSKHDALMADSGIGEFCLPVWSLDQGGLTRMFMELENRRPELLRSLADRKAINEKLLKEQFEGLWEALFPARRDVQ